MRTHTRMLIAATAALGTCSLLLNCASEANQPSFGCSVPDGGARPIACRCYDGDPRCHPVCPADLTAPCTAPDECGDFSGGSASPDCLCTCTASGTWSCSGPSGACTPS